MNNALENHDCPALMSDGRHGTDYRPSCYVHNLISTQNGIKNSHNQRQFLQNNAVHLMGLNLQIFQKRAGCSSNYYHVDPHGHDEYWVNYKKNLQ